MLLNRRPPITAPRSSWRADRKARPDASARQYVRPRIRPRFREGGLAVRQCGYPWRRQRNAKNRSARPGLLRGRDQIAKQRQVLLPQHEDVQPAEQGIQLIGGEVAFLVESASRFRRLRLMPSIRVPNSSILTCACWSAGRRAAAGWGWPMRQLQAACAPPGIPLAAAAAVRRTPPTRAATGPAKSRCARPRGSPPRRSPYLPDAGSPVAKRRAAMGQEPAARAVAARPSGEAVPWLPPWANYLRFRIARSCRATTSAEFAATVTPGV